MRYSVVSATDASKIPTDFISQDILALFVSRKPHSVRESLSGRLLVARLARIPPEHINRFLLGSLDGHHDQENGCFWSISHKEGAIAAAVDDRPVGIDIEKLHPRDLTLFDVFDEDEWRILGEKDWPHYYRGWTAKEAALKVLSLGLDQHAEVRIAEKIGDTLILTHGKRRVVVESIQQDDLVIAVARKER